MKKTRFLLIVFVILGALVLAACQPQTVEVTRVVTETETVTEEVPVEDSNNIEKTDSFTFNNNRIGNVVVTLTTQYAVKEKINHIKNGIIFIIGRNIHHIIVRN